MNRWMTLLAGVPRHMEGFADGSKDARDEAKMDWASVGWPRIDLGWFHDKQFRQDLGFCELNED